MFIFLWIISIVISYFIGRQIVKIADWQFDGDFGFLLLFLLGGLLPFANLIVYAIAWGVCVYDEKDYSESDIVKKIFRVKDDE